jgi:hypothetical protein
VRERKSEREKGKVRETCGWKVMCGMCGGGQLHHASLTPIDGTTKEQGEDEGQRIKLSLRESREREYIYMYI